MGRSEQRAQFPTEIRLPLLEGDMDDAEAQLDRLDARLGKMLWALIGILISTTTASILLALNLAVAR